MLVQRCKFSFYSILVACVFSLSLFSSVNAEELSGPAPDFTLKSNQGNLKLSEQQGDVVMINFWASWCGPCRQEMPLLEGLFQKYQDLGFTIWGVNVEEDSSKADGFLRKVEVNFPILYDAENEVSEKYNLIAMPSTVFVDRDGNQRFFHAGYRPGDEAEYERIIRLLVRE